MIKGIGKVQPLPFVSLNSVLFAAECPHNLISISKLTKTLDYSAIFMADSVIVNWIWGRQ